MATNPTQTPPRPRSGRRHALAIAAVFFVNGATFASWSPRLPELQARLDVSDAALGLTLLGAGAGGLLASGASGWLVDRRGSRTVTVSTSVALSLWLPMMALAPSAAAVFGVLILLGALDGLTDVAMNSQAVELQRRVRYSIVSRFHALWSAGAVIGGIVASRAAAAGVTLRSQLLVTAVALAVATLLAARWLLPDARPDHAGDADPRVRTSRPLLVRLFLVGMAIALAELPPNDWAALMMADRFDIGEGQAALGFVAAAGGMLVGRIVGDRVTDRLGRELTRRGGAALAAFGVVMATTLPSPVLAGVGLFATGLGLSSLFPLLFRAASDLTAGSHSGMASFSTGARLGFLLASPLVGLVAEVTSVATGMLAVAGLAAAVVAASRLPPVTPPA